MLSCGFGEFLKETPPPYNGRKNYHYTQICVHVCQLNTDRIVGNAHLHPFLYIRQEEITDRNHNENIPIFCIHLPNVCFRLSHDRANQGKIILDNDPSEPIWSPEHVKFRGIHVGKK